MDRTDKNTMYSFNYLLMDYVGKKNMHLFFSIPIGLLYAVFFTKLANYIMEYPKIKNMCNDLSLAYFRSPSTQKNNNEMNENDKKRFACYEERDKKMKEFNRKQFNIMMIIGLIGIIAGVILHKQGGNTQVAGSGIALGGLMLIVYFILTNWWTMDELSRITISGTVLAVLIIGSYFIFI